MFDKLRKYLLMIMIVFCLLLFCFMLLENIPPKVLTRSNMWLLTRELYNFFENEDKVPESLSDVPYIANNPYVLRDRWGNDIDCSLAPTGLVKLTSLGKDAKPDGTGDNADMVVSFDLNNWEDEYEVMGMISPALFTQVKMRAIERAVQEYHALHGQMPADLTHLTALDRRTYDNNDKDYWGNSIIFSIKDDEVTLLSMGRDGQEGGKREDADLAHIFTLNKDTVERNK